MTSCSLETLQAIRLKVVEASPDAKIVINRRREIIDLNEEAEFLFGYARGDLLGKEIERRFGERIYQEVCIPHNLDQGACLLIAVQAAQSAMK